MKFFKKFIPILILLLSVSSCSSEKFDKGVESLGESDKGVYFWSWTQKDSSKEWVSFKLFKGKFAISDWSEKRISKLNLSERGEPVVFKTVEEAKSSIDKDSVAYISSENLYLFAYKPSVESENEIEGNYVLQLGEYKTISISLLKLWRGTGIYGFLMSSNDKIVNEKAHLKILEEENRKAEEAARIAHDNAKPIAGYGNFIMIAVGMLLLFLAIKFGFEPLLLVPIGIGCMLANIPFAYIASFVDEGFIGILYHFGVANGLFPILIFMGVGAMTDFGPLLANPKTLILGAAAQFGIFAALLGAVALGDWDWLTNLLGGTPLFNLFDAASIGIIGGADGPTAIYVTRKLSPGLLGPIAVAAYSYMALVPIIQPPIMRLFTTKKERLIKMEQLRHVSNREKIIFPIVSLFLCILLLPSATPLIGALMFGNLVNVCGVTDRLSDTMKNSLINIVTICLGLSVGSKMQAEKFLSVQTLGILALGLIAFSIGTMTGVLLAKLMNKLSKHPINPLIGAAGVSAVPMAARVANKVGQEENPQNFLLMHAMGPNVAGVIGSAVAAGVLLALVPFLAG